MEHWRVGNGKLVLGYGFTEDEGSAAQSSEGWSIHFAIYRLRINTQSLSSRRDRPDLIANAEFATADDLGAQAAFVD